jgi:hypothetical protein
MLECFNLFKYGQLGHISPHRCFITLHPYSSSPPILSYHTVSPSIPLASSNLDFLTTSSMTSHSRVLRFVENNLYAKMEADLASGIVLEAKDV